MSASPDDNHFEEIYRGIPAGLTITATRLDHFETLRSFCFSLKGAAIRLGSNAMFFGSQYSKRNWVDKGLLHFRSFVEKHTANGVRLFFIDQPTGYADREVAHLLGELSESSGVSVLLTAIARCREQNNEKWLAALEDGRMVFCSAPTITLRGRSTRQLTSRSTPVEVEGFPETKTILRVSYATNVLEHDFYSATTTFAGREEQHSPLCFLEVCPQPPNIQGEGGTAKGCP